MTGQTSKADATAKPTVRRQIFVSYRREDEGWALTITNALRDHFGESRVFQDVDRIDAGTDFVERIEQAMGESGAMVALVGPNWMQAGPTGREGIHDPSDFIRAEIAMALRKGVTIVPVRLGTAEMPRQRELPQEIAKFARLESKRLDRDHWQEDIRALASRLERLVGKPTRKRRPAPPQPDTAESIAAREVEARAPAPGVWEPVVPSYDAPILDAAPPEGVAPAPYASPTTPTAAAAGGPAAPIAAPAVATSPTDVRRPQRPGWVLPAVSIGLVAVVAMVAVLLLPRAPAGSTPSQSGGVAGATASAPSTPSSVASTDVRLVQWTPAEPPHNVPFGAAGVAYHKGELWVAGGETSGDDLTAVTSFDPVTARWTRRADLDHPITHAALVSDGERLYLIGGIIKGADGNQVVDTVYRLDDPAGAWTLDTSLPAPRMSGAAAWDGERIVFAGGVPSTEQGMRIPSAKVWTLDGRWRELEPLRTAREHLAAATDGNGTVWFMGGEDRPNELVMDSVDAVRDSAVTAASPISLARQGLAAVWTAQTGPCALGGATDLLGRKPSEAVDCPEAASRAVLPPLPSPRYVLGAAVLDDAIYVVGGAKDVEPSDTVLVTTPR
jgi:hypothetical protein